MKMIKEGNRSLLYVSQLQEEAEFLLQLLRGMTAVRVDAGGPNSAVSIRIMPDLHAMMSPATTEYDKLTEADLATKAVEAGIPVTKDTVRDDLVKIIEVAKEDLPKAKEMAKKVRPAQKKMGIPPQANTGNGGGFQYSAKSSNAGL